MHDATSQFYVHHSGCALVQPVFESALEDPLDSSSPHCSPRSTPQTACGGDEIRFGFRWHKNHIFLKQKNTSSSLLVKHQSLLNELRTFCAGGGSDSLADFCQKFFTE